MFTKKLLDSGKIELKSGHFTAISDKKGNICHDMNLDICTRLLYMHYYKKDPNQIIEIVFKNDAHNINYKLYTKEVRE